MRKKSRKDEKTLEELNSAHCRLQAKCQLLQTVTLNELNCSCFCHIINIPVWENLDLGRVYRPHCVRSVLTTSVKILPYRPPARLIRAKYKRSQTFRLFQNAHDPHGKTIRLLTVPLTFVLYSEIKETLLCFLNNFESQPLRLSTVRLRYSQFSQNISQHFTATCHCVRRSGTQT